MLFFGVPVVDLPRCEVCGGNHVDFFIDRVVLDGKPVLAACVSCGDAVEDVEDDFDFVCESAPLVVDVSASGSWREVVRSLANAWSLQNGGEVFDSLPDDLDDDVAWTEIRFGLLPDFLRLG